MTILEFLELGGGLCLSDRLAGDLTRRDLVDSIDGSSGSLSNALGRASDGGEQKTSIGIDGTGSVDLGARGGLGLAENGETRRPLNGRLATKKRAEDGDFRLVELASERAGAREGNDHSVATVMCKTLLTTVILGLLGTLAKLLEGSGRDVVEKLANPLGELAVVGTVGDNSKVRLGVCALGEVLDGLGVEVLGVRCLRGGGSRVAETTVESKAVGRVDGHFDGAADEALVGEVDQRKNLLVVNVGYFCQQAFLSTSCFVITYAGTWSDWRPRQTARQSRAGHREGT